MLMGEGNWIQPCKDDVPEETRRESERWFASLFANLGGRVEGGWKGVCFSVILFECGALV